jgi:hypothetical protein
MVTGASWNAGSTQRCMGVVGTVWTGPLYCGNRAASVDRNGRPVCGIHHGRQEVIEWRGGGGCYPYGPGDPEGQRWRFAHGAPR